MIHQEALIHHQMGKSEQSEECRSAGRESKDRRLMGQADFETLVIGVKNLHTVISLLKCDEGDVVVSTLTALAKFVRKSLGNIPVLVEYQVLGDVLLLIRHEDFRIRRSATRLLAEMTVLESTRTIILSDEKEKNHLHRLMNILHDESDAAVQENVSKIVCNFADDIFGACQILKSPHLKSLLVGLQSADLHVTRNHLEILQKLMASPFAAERICSLKEFCFELFYDVEFDEESGAIPEIALSLMKNFLIRRENEKIHQQFRDSEGLEKLLEMIRTSVGEELHLPAFELLAVATGNYKTAEYVHALISHEEISDFLSMTDVIVLQLIANLSAVPDFRKILYDLGIIEIISMNLNTELNPEIVNPICSIIEKICHLRPAMNELIERDMTHRLIEILKTEDIGWQMKDNVLFALKELVSRNNRNGESLVDSNDHWSLIKVAQDHKVPMHVRLGSLNVVNALICRPKLRRFFVHSAIVEMLSNFFDDRIVDELAIGSLSILSHLFVEEEARRLCLKTNFLGKLCSLICTEYPLPVHSCAIQLIQQLCSEEFIVDECVRIGYLHALLKNHQVMRGVIPSWETCLQTMLSGHLPLKFAITGHLSLHDITKNGFYVEKRHRHTFPSLNELLASRCSPIQCLYTINFCNDTLTPPGGTSESSIYWTDTFEDDRSSGMCFSETVSIICEEKFGHLKADPRLCQSLDMFLQILQTNESVNTAFSDSPSVIDIGKIESRAKLLGKFVAHKLSDVHDSSDECMTDKLKNHLQELRETLETSIIPLGELRFGSYLERALLFKAIADRICLPAALVRGEYGKSWVEVALPQCHEEPSRNCLPTRLLRPNYIVDLMDHPGDLIHVDSIRARKFYEYS
ncbi:armadillo repeat-containing protein 3 [Diachasmimorpha longicaudata]|uniref:armadillo repeat-containing protein 3 n=1 Tax=Diachasmimorpha longicaudata TaxID=58733 RepID=UPI0030B87483